MLAIAVSDVDPGQFLIKMKPGAGFLQPEQMHQHGQADWLHKMKCVLTNGVHC